MPASHVHFAYTGAQSAAQPCSFISESFGRAGTIGAQTRTDVYCVNILAMQKVVGSNPISRFARSPVWSIGR
jgi:hypothetical protein